MDGKKKEEGSSASGKSANSHVLVETMASITEVADNEISASLYAARSDHWMLDSGATHHITPQDQTSAATLLKQALYTSEISLHKIKSM